MGKALAAISISVAGQLGVFVMSIVAARALGADGRGTYSLYQVTVGGLLVVAGFGIGAGLVKAAAQDQMLRVPDLIPTGSVMNLVAALPVVVLYLSLGHFFSFTPVLQLGLSVSVAVLVAVVFSALSIPQRQYLLTVGSYRLAKLHGALIAAVAAPAFVALYIAGSHDVSLYVWSFAVGAGAVLGVTHVLMRRRTIVGSFNAGLARDAAAFSRVQYACELEFFALSRLDVFLVAALLGTDQLGLYSAAVALSEIVSRIPIELGTLVFPAVATGRLNSRQLEDLTRRLLYGAASCAVVGIVAARSIVTHLYGAEFAPAVGTFQILLGGAVALSLLNLCWSIQAGRGRQRTLPLCLAAAICLDLGLILGLARTHGIAAVGLAATASYVLALFWVLKTMCRDFEIPARRVLLPQSDDLQALVNFSRRVKHWLPSAPRQ